MNVLTYLKHSLNEYIATMHTHKWVAPFSTNSEYEIKSAVFILKIELFELYKPYLT